MITHSKIFRGEVTHKRQTPTTHAFTYPVTFFAFDLSELTTIKRLTSTFGHNEARPVSLHDCDYLHGKRKPILDQLNEFLEPQTAGQNTLLITSPRYFGHAFNPVNFHLRMKDGELLAAVAEVNNTFGDRHVYPLQKLELTAPHTWTARCPKDFHVSPFNNMEGQYHFTFRIEESEIFLGVDLYRENACVLKTWIQGTKHPLTQSNLIRYFLLHPFHTALNSMPRIVWQAALLYYKKRLKAHKRPSPKSPQTLIDRDHSERPRTVI